MFDERDHIDEVVDILAEGKWYPSLGDITNRMRYAYLYIAKNDLAAAVLERFGLSQFTLSIEDAYALLWWIPNIMIDNARDSSTLFSRLRGKNIEEIREDLVNKLTYDMKNLEDIEDQEKAEDRLNLLNDSKLTDADIIYLYLFGKLVRESSSKFGIRCAFPHPYNAVSINLQRLIHNNYEDPIVYMPPYEIKMDQNNRFFVVNYDNIDKIRDKLGALPNPLDLYINDDFKRYDSTINRDITNIPEIISNSELIMEDRKVVRYQRFFTDREIVMLYGNDLSFLDPEDLHDWVSYTHTGKISVVKMGRTIEASVVNHMLHGEYIMTKERGVWGGKALLEAYYTNGILNGHYQYTEEHENGIKKMEGYMVNGQKDGIWKLINGPDILDTYWIKGREIPASVYYKKEIQNIHYILPELTNIVSRLV